MPLKGKKGRTTNTTHARPNIASLLQALRARDERQTRPDRHLSPSGSPPRRTALFRGRKAPVRFRLYEATSGHRRGRRTGRSGSGRLRSAQLGSARPGRAVPPRAGRGRVGCLAGSLFLLHGGYLNVLLSITRHFLHGRQLPGPHAGAAPHNGGGSSEPRSPSPAEPLGPRGPQLAPLFNCP